MTLPPPTPLVTLLNPGTPEQDALLRWVDAEDPALVANTEGAEPPGLLQFNYRPSYSSLRTPPRTLPPEPERPEPPPSPIQITPGLETMKAGGEPAPRRASIPTRVICTGNLKGRELAAPGAPAYVSAVPLQPARFLVGLDPRGQAQFVYLQDSSGEPAADAAAEAFLARAQFSHVDEETGITWGFAEILWGDESYGPAATSTISSEGKHP